MVIHGCNSWIAATSPPSFLSGCGRDGILVLTGGRVCARQQVRAIWQANASGERLCGGRHLLSYAHGTGALRVRDAVAATRLRADDGLSECAKVIGERCPTLAASDLHQEWGSACQRAGWVEALPSNTRRRQVR